MVKQKSFEIKTREPISKLELDGMPL